MALQSVIAMYRTVQPENYKLKAPEMTRMDRFHSRSAAEWKSEKRSASKNGMDPQYRRWQWLWIRVCICMLCCGRGSDILDPGYEFFHPGSRNRIFLSGSRLKKIPDPGSASKNLSMFNPKNCFFALGNMIRDVHHGSRSCFFISRIQGSKRHRIPDPQQCLYVSMIIWVTATGIDTEL